MGQVVGHHSHRFHPLQPTQYMPADPSKTRSSARGTDAEIVQVISRHPLEVFPYFRRWKPGIWRDIAYTAIWNTLLALVFTAFFLVFDSEASVARVLRTNMVIAQCIGFLIHFLFLVTDRWVSVPRRRSSAARITYYTIVPAIGVYAGYWLASALLGWSDLQSLLLSARGVLGIMLLTVIISSVLLAILIPRERAAHALLRIAQEEARVAAAEKETTVARMQLLEAQVEPHFLYNTMAHVVSLIDAEPATAKRMLERLTALLRLSASAGSAGGTLQGQVDHLRAYLDILGLRMGPRLRWTIDIPPELAALPVPPMLLQPVVENAIKHGLEPKLEGGTISVTARRDDGRLVLAVTDTGMGFREHRDSRSTGLGLPNLRDRLATLFGGAASVTIEDHAPAGARVTIALPLPAAAQ